MGYDPKSVKVKKAEKAIAILMFNLEKERHYIRETVIAQEKNNRTRSSRNKGDKDE